MHVIRKTTAKFLRVIASRKVAAYVFIASGILIVASAPAVSADAQSYEDIDWTELMPAEDLSALLNRPAFLDDIADGSAQDALDSFQQRQLEDEQAQQYQAALSSTRVIQEFDGIVSIEQKVDAMGTSAYSLSLDNYALYEE